MSILLPDAGLFFWMLLAFGIVLFILAKYAFPVITTMIDERKRFIDESLKSAVEANARLADIQAEGEALLNSAREEQNRILRDAARAREQLLQEAREQADAEGAKIIAEARRVIEQEKETALNDIRNNVADISLAIAAKILRRDLASEEKQQAYAEQLVDEVLDKKR